MTTADWKDLGVVCIVGRHPVNPKDPFLHWEATGWTHRRARGAKGGAHDLARPVYTGRVICDKHWSESGSWHEGQESLL